ncbi:MAG: metallophosphoesterase, partial [Oceanospirillales bacterium]
MHNHDQLPTPLNYLGQEWIDAHLPTTFCNWLEQKQYGWVVDGQVDQSLVEELTNLANPDTWQWPDHLVVFVTDLHADAEAFSASLVASGLFERHGEQPNQISIAADTPVFEIIIGGDCLDKGPANLPLLRLIRQLLDQQIPITLLSGNHDLRLQLAVNTLKAPDCTLNGHFLIRLGSKVMPLCVELLNEYPLTPDEQSRLPSEAECLARLLPSDDWHLRFQQEATSHLTASQIHTELSRLESRKQRFFRAAEKAQLSMQQIFAALERWRQLFLEPNGEFHWFVRDQQLGCRRGS